MSSEPKLKLDEVYNVFINRTPYNLQLSWKDEVEIFFRHHWSNIRIFFFNIVDGIRNVVYYLPTIWKDRDWDYEYTLDILKAKLKKQRNYLQKENLVVETPQMVNQINDTLQAIDDFDNYFEVCEYSSQGLLKEIQDTLDCHEQEPLVQNFFIKAEKIKQERWCKIFDTMKDFMQGWWS